MGNRLSGNFGRRWSKKAFTHELPALDLRHFLDGQKVRLGSYRLPLLNGQGLLLDVHPNQVIIRAPANVWNRLVQGVSIETTGDVPSRQRRWFSCPSLRCGRRVIALYFRNGFFCRHCLGLSYASQHLSKVQRMFREYALLDQRLGLVEGDSVRPKGMHRATYKPLAERARRLHAYLFGTGERALRWARDLDHLSPSQLQAERRQYRKSKRYASA